MVRCYFLESSIRSPYIKTSNGEDMGLWQGPVINNKGKVEISDRPDIEIITEVHSKLMDEFFRDKEALVAFLYEQCCQDVKEVLLKHIVEWIPKHDFDLTDRELIFEEITDALLEIKLNREEPEHELLGALQNIEDILLGKTQDEAS